MIGSVEGATAVSKHENRFARIKRDLAVLKWIIGTTLAGIIALVIRTFIA
jgi:hypothetical protein